MKCKRMKDDELELETIKLRDMINITKSHILRLVFCSIVTGVILWAVGVINRVFMYVFIRCDLDLMQNNINSNVPIEVILTVLIWNYILGFVVIGLCWKYLGMPRVTLVGKLYKRYMDMYYDEGE